MLEIIQPQVLYSSERSRDYRVVAVLVAGQEMPTRDRCEVAVAMDPEIDSAVAVFPVGGLMDGEECNHTRVRAILSLTAPEYAPPEFTLRCTRILDLVLVKVLVRRT
jgi:hypothetical protein